MELACPGTDNRFHAPQFSVRFGVEQHERVDAGGRRSAPAPSVRSLLPLVAQCARPIRRRHALLVRNRKCREAVVRDSNALQSRYREADHRSGGAFGSLTPCCQRFHRLEPIATFLRRTGKRYRHASGMGKASQTAERQRRYLRSLQLVRRAWPGTKAREPVRGIGLGLCGGEALANRRVRADAIGGDVRVCGVPEIHRTLLPARPAHKPVAIVPTDDEIARAREFHTVAPDRGNAVRACRVLDEVADVAFPGAVVVGQEYHLVGARNVHPAGKMNDAIRPEKSGPAEHSHEPHGPESETQRETPECPRLQGRHRVQQVLRGVCFVLHDIGDELFAGLEIQWSVDLFVTAQPVVGKYCDDRHGERREEPTQYDQQGRRERAPEIPDGGDDQSEQRHERPQERHERRRRELHQRGPRGQDVDRTVRHGVAEVRPDEWIDSAFRRALEARRGLWNECPFGVAVFPDDLAHALETLDRRQSARKPVQQVRNAGGEIAFLQDAASGHAGRTVKWKARSRPPRLPERARMALQKVAKRRIGTDPCRPQGLLQWQFQRVGDRGERGGLGAVGSGFEYQVRIIVFIARNHRKAHEMDCADGVDPGAQRRAHRVAHFLEDCLDVRNLGGIEGYDDGDEGMAHARFKRRTRHEDVREIGRGAAARQPSPRRASDSCAE